MIVFMVPSGCLSGCQSVIWLKRSLRDAQKTHIFPLKILWGFNLFQKRPYTRRSVLNVPSRLQVQHKIQQGQLLDSHPDDHYCAPLFKYFKIKAVTEKYYVMAFCRDDKSNVHVRETDAIVSTGVRAHKSITPKWVTLEALDHDLPKSFLTSNVALKCDILASTDKSFIRGNLNYTVIVASFTHHLLCVTELCYVKSSKNSNMPHQSR